MRVAKEVVGNRHSVIDRLHQRQDSFLQQSCKVLLLLLCSPAEQLGSLSIHYCIDAFFSQGDRTACETVFLLTLPHVQPHAVFRGFTSLSAEWPLLCKEIILAENSPHITMECITTL